MYLSGSRSVTTLLVIAALALGLAGCSFALTPTPVWPTVAATRVTPPPREPTPAAQDASAATATTVGVPPTTATEPSVPTATAVLPTDTQTATSTAAPTPTPAPPTDTPTAIPTNTPTATASATPTPSVTLTPTASVSPTVTPTAIPTPAFPIASVFRSAWRDYPMGIMGYVSHNHPGQPLGVAYKEQVSRQRFGAYSTGTCTARETIFLWRETAEEIYVLFGGNTGLHPDACPDFWEAYPDIWEPGDPNNEDLEAPPGLVVPVMGFGAIWREMFYGRSERGLGFALGPEQYTTATVQQFENAVALHFPDTDEVYVLFPAFRYTTRSGELTGRVWFRNP